MQALLQSSKAYRLVKTEKDENRLSHAYLLSFDDARNLRFALKTFAKLFFDQQDARILNLIDEESFSDCLFYPEKDKKMKVEDAEKILEESVLTPVEGDKKLFVVENFADANIQTQNKLLKLLEEPPVGVYFLLGATTEYSVLTTVLSRVKKIELAAFTVDELTKALSRIYASAYDDSTLALCAAASDGNLGKAQNMLEGGYYKSFLEQAFSLCLCQSHILPTVIKQVGEIKKQKEFLSVLRILFRDALVIKTQGSANKKNLLLSAEIARLNEVATAYTTESLLYAQEVITLSEKQIFTNANFAQCIEICIAKIRQKNKS